MEFVGGEVELTEEGKIRVDERMRSVSFPHIFAVGDCASSSPLTGDQSPFWFEMDLWGQAREMGRVAGMAMTNPSLGEVDLGIPFEVLVNASFYHIYHHH